MKSIVKAIEFDNLVKKLGAFTPTEKLVGAYHSVRDIPYGGTKSGDFENVLKVNQGTGRGKHALLKNMFESLGYKVDEYFASHNLAQYPIDPWPEPLKDFRGKNITSFHYFLKVKIDGTFVTVDATFDKALVPLGFPLLEWDGASDMKLPVQPKEIMKVKGDTAAYLLKLINELPEGEKADRQLFLKTLKQWLDEERAKSDVIST